MKSIALFFTFAFAIAVQAGEKMDAFLDKAKDVAAAPLDIAGMAAISPFLLGLGLHDDARQYIQKKKGNSV